MSDGLTRRELMIGAGAVVALPLIASDQDGKDLIAKIKDPGIRAGVAAAVTKNLIPAAAEKEYPGHFYISADGGAYGNDTTWPGLDSWQIAGAYLLLGRTRIVTDYFDFVRASQRADGNIPFAIFSGDTRPGTTYLRGMKYPEDEFSYTPPSRPGATKKWMRLFTHWEVKSNPLATLGPVCYVLTAAEIYDAVRSRSWLKERISSVESAAFYLYSLKSPNGLIGGSGFYQELPPREGWDGVTQCYCIHAFRELARLMRVCGSRVSAGEWTMRADELSAAFVKTFWQTDHFAEYVHVTHGLVDIHGLTDTNWAAVAFGVARDEHLKQLWSRLMHEEAFWLGGVPTQTVTKPFEMKDWENDPVPFDLPSLTSDVAAMGRVWYLEAMACKRMHAWDRLRESTRKVCAIAKDGYWRERYHPERTGVVSPGGAEKYCEYPAVLARVVFGNSTVFTK